MPKIVLLKQAVLDIEDSTAYYAAIRPSLGQQLQKSAAHALKSLRTFCKYPIRYDGIVRVYRLHGSPYLIHFVFNEAVDVVEVQTVQHMSRQSGLSFFG